MNLGTVIAVVAGLFGLGLALAGLLLTWRLLWPGLIERVAQRMQHRPGRALALGIVLLPLTVLLLAALFAAPVGLIKLGGWIGLLLVLALLTIGLAGLALRMSLVWPQGAMPVAPAAAFFRSALALELALLVPLLGWFLLLPLLGAFGLGALSMALFERPAPLRPVPQEAAHVAHTP